MVFNKLKLKEIHNAKMTSFLIPDSAYINTTLVINNLSLGDILINDNWWARDALNRGVYVDAYGSEHFPMPKQLAGVRPLYTVLHKELDVGDRFILKNHIFKMIGSDIALCETVIGFTTQDNIINYLAQWNGSSQYNAPVKDIIYKIIGFEECECPIDKVTSPFCSTPDAQAHEKWMNGYEYWTNSRVDEFSCRVIDKSGFVCKDNIFAQHDICPMVLFTQDIFKLLGFDNDELFEINGRVFRVINKSFGVTLCLNTIGFSCFSTGIAEIGNEEEEKEYIREAEATKIITDWLFDVA